MMEVRRLEESNYRMDHQDFGEVYRVTYDVGEIIGFNLLKTDPIEVDDTCNVKMGTTEFEKVPIFYHCKKNFYSEDTTSVMSNGALKHGAYTFTVGSKVKVMLKDAKPLYVIGHEDGKPRRCHMIWKHGFHQYSSFGTGYDPREFTRYYHGVNQTIYCDLNVPCKGPDGKDLNTTKEATRICGGREIQFATTTYYIADWLIPLGPVLYLWQITAFCFPLPMTALIQISAAAHTQELWDATVAWGKRKEGQLPSQIFQPMPSYILPPGFYPQQAFQKLIAKDYFSWTPPQPRWIASKFLAQESPY